MSFFKDKRFEVLKENREHFFSNNNLLPQIDEKCCSPKKDRAQDKLDRFFKDRITIGPATKECNC